jgi:hypothetical protein
VGGLNDYHCLPLSDKQSSKNGLSVCQLRDVARTMPAPLLYGCCMVVRACSPGYPRFCFSPSSLSLPQQRPLVACRALSGLTLAAAVRTNRAGGLPARPIPRTLLPIGQRSRLATAIADDAGVLLPHPFTPYQGCPWRDCSLLPSCVPAPFRVRGPRLRFRGVAFHWSRAAQWARSREVPLEHSVSSDGIWQTRSLLISISHTMGHRVRLNLGKRSRCLFGQSLGPQASRLHRGGRAPLPIPPPTERGGQVGGLNDYSRYIISGIRV